MPDGKHNNLNKLLQTNHEANQYFNSLPGYVKEQISNQGGYVSSYSNLQDYAENLLQGNSR